VAHQTFDELEWYLRRLQYARKEGKLVFVLGAGINKEYGLPDWAETLVRLTKRGGKLDALAEQRSKEFGARAEPRGESESKQFIDDVIADPLLQAAAIRGAYTSSSDWLRALGHELTPSPEVLKDKSKPLGKVAKIVAEQHRGDPHRHIAILTFNYDDLMEGALRQELGEEEAKRVVVSVSNATEMGRARQRPGIYIYHLHGSLANKDSDIVLDAYTYVRILSAPGNHWSWACMNTFLFQKDSGAMFIGLSLLDPSLRLLLTRSATNGMPLSAVFVGKPLEPKAPQPRPIPIDTLAGKTKEELLKAADKALKLELRRAAAEALKVAWMMRDVQTLFDNLLEELSLIPYHVTAWSEVGPLLDRVMEND
jgi:hypothetical protein